MFLAQLMDRGVVPQNEIGHQGVRQLEQGKEKIIESISDIGLRCTWDIVTCVCVGGEVPGK